MRGGIKVKKKLLSILMVALTSVTVLAGCGAKDSPDSGGGQRGGKVTKPDNDLVIAIEGSVSSLDPHNISDTNAISATRGMYETLIGFDDKQEMVGLLAEDWEVSEDSKTYTFNLRSGVKFHDGTDFNAEAVKANFDRLLNAENKLRHRRTYFITAADGSETPRIVSIEAKDETTLVITLTEPYSIFLNKLTQLAIISPEAIKTHGNDIMFNPSGTGPFKYSKWVEGDHTAMVRNEEYWGEKAKVDSVTIKEVPEAGTRVAMLQTGEADLIYPMPSDQLATIEKSEDASVKTSTSNIMRYVTLNSNLKELSNVKVRQAMNYAIDKNAYIQVMYSGYGEIASSPVPEVIMYYAEQEPYTYDLDKAKALMEEAGYKDGFNLTIWGDNTTQEIKGMTFIQQQLAQIGIKVDVVPMEPATVSEKIYVPLEEAEINMWYVNWSASDFSTDSSMRALLHSAMMPPVSANTAYYNNKKFDELLDKALTITDTDELENMYKEIQTMAWEDAPWLFLGNDQIIYAAKNYLSGAYVAPDGKLVFNSAEIAK